MARFLFQGAKYGYMPLNIAQLRTFKNVTSDFEVSKRTCKGPSRSYAEQLEFVSENVGEGMEKELLAACSVPFGKADTRRKMYRSSVLNHSCPVFKFPSAEGHWLPLPVTGKPSV